MGFACEGSSTAALEIKCETAGAFLFVFLEECSCLDEGELSILFFFFQGRDGSRIFLAIEVDST